MVETIEEVESWFAESSMLILRFIEFASSYSDMDQLNWLFISVSIMLESFSFTLNETMSLFQKLFEAMQNEFHTKELSEHLKQKYRQIKTIPALHDDNYMPDDFLRLPINTFKNATIKLYQNITLYTYEGKESLFSDLLHMHLNRFFIESTRKQELIFYYTMYKHYQSQIARKSKDIRSVCS